MTYSISVFWKNNNMHSKERMYIHVREILCKMQLPCICKKLPEKLHMYSVHVVPKSTTVLSAHRCNYSAQSLTISPFMG